MEATNTHIQKHTYKLVIISIKITLFIKDFPNSPGQLTELGSDLENYFVILEEPRIHYFSAVTFVVHRNVLSIYCLNTTRLLQLTLGNFIFILKILFIFTVSRYPFIFFKTFEKANK